ncbi:MAG: DUF465 domain-containing protein [Deltaproteobacteria bacterium]|nr:DUF465 domain-containing protein [Deltaproteobacteria bacterium]
MDQTEEKIILPLLDKDPELKRFYDEHQELENKLQSYQNRSYLSADEEMEKKRLQKLKLAGKDRMMEIVMKYRQMLAQKDSR